MLWFKTHFSYILSIYVLGGNYYPFYADKKKIEAERHSLSQSVKIQTQSPSANSTSFPITPPRLSSKSITDIQFGTMVWVVLPPILQGLRQSSKGDHNGEDGVCLPGSAVCWAVSYVLEAVLVQGAPEWMRQMRPLFSWSFYSWGEGCGKTACQ